MPLLPEKSNRGDLDRQIQTRLTARTRARRRAIPLKERGNAWLQYYVTIAVVVFSTAIAPALGDDNRNFALIAFMGISLPLIFFMPLRLSNNQLILILFLATMTLVQPLINPASMRWSTVLFSTLFAATFIAYELAFKASRLRISSFERLIRLLLVAFFAVLLIQQLCVVVGLPVFNASNYSVRAPWKLNSLAAEASHAARVIGLLMFAYLSIREIRTFEPYSLIRNSRRDWMIWLGFLWAIVSMQSATAFIILPLVLSKLLNKSNMAILVPAVFIVFPIVLFNNAEELERVYAIGKAAASLQYTAVLSADHSGAMRVAPLIFLSSKVELLSWGGLFGHGVDTVSLFLSDYIGGVEKGTSGGGLLRHWYEYGFISLLLYIVFTLRASGALTSLPVFIFWFLFIFFAGVNNQYVWLFLILSSSISEFRSRASTLQR